MGESGFDHFQCPPRVLIYFGYVGAFERYYSYTTSQWGWPPTTRVLEIRGAKSELDACYISITGMLPRSRLTAIPFSIHMNRTQVIIQGYIFYLDMDRGPLCTGVLLVTRILGLFGSNLVSWISKNDHPRSTRELVMMVINGRNQECSAGRRRFKAGKKNYFSFQSSADELAARLLYPFIVLSDDICTWYIC